MLARCVLTFMATKRPEKREAVGNRWEIHCDKPSNHKALKQAVQGRYERCNRSGGCSGITVNDEELSITLDWSSDVTYNCAFAWVRLPESKWYCCALHLFV